MFTTAYSEEPITTNNSNEVVKCYSIEKGWTADTGTTWISLKIVMLTNQSQTHKTM